MRAKVLLIIIILSIFLLINSVSIISDSSNDNSQAPLSVGKDVFEVGETVELSINIDPGEYALYELHIYALNNSYTYKGDFNPIMFFYPTEESIYTTALVEKSTRAIFYSLSFSVITPVASEGLANGDIFQTESIDSVVSKPVQEVGTDEPFALDTSKISIFTDKSVYVEGESVRVFVEVEDESAVILYHSFNGVSKRYMGDLKYINFIPLGVGTHELLLEDTVSNTVQVYSFEVLPSSREPGAKEPGENGSSVGFIKVINSRGTEESFEVNVFDESGGFASVEIIPDKKVIKKIRLNNMKTDADVDLSLGVDEVPIGKVKVKSRNVIKAFAIDPSGLNFTNGTATGVAVGNELWKCKDWDFANQQCLGVWQKLMDLVPGQEYDIFIDANDPGFAEVIEITKAFHLDENKTIISNIYDEVKEKDNIWSEPIYENQYVRVTFEEYLTSSNDITLYVRNNQSLNTSIEVYYFNSTQKITQFPIIAEEKYYTIFLTNMLGSHDTFDLKIINTDTGIAYLEFDHIIDPSTAYDPNSNITIAWDDGTGTNGFAEIDEGVRYPSTSGMTGDYVAENTQSFAGVSAFGFPSVTQNPSNITLWVYTATGGSCSYTFSLLQSGTPRCSQPVTDGTPAGWYNCTWDNPTGDLSALSINLSSVSKGTGGHSDCVVYEAYLNVSYNNPPNVTNLTNPGNNSNLSSGTNIDFNFTVFDDEAPVYNCTLWTNFTGVWTANETVDNVNVDTETNISIDVPDGSFIWNINCTDSTDLSDVYDWNYFLRVDSTYPTINYSSEVEPNNTYINRNWTFVNVTADDANEKNITFRIYNMSGLQKNVTYTGGERNHNFTDLDSDEKEYWYNVTICDQFGWCNSTGVKKISLDSSYPIINYSSGTENNDTYFSKDWVFVNVTANDTNEKNITFGLYNISGLVSNVTYTGGERNHNFSDLDPNSEYWYNVTIVDLALNENTTLNYKITLDNSYPTINYSSGVLPNNSFINSTWIYVNVTANDTNEKNITFGLYDLSGEVNVSTYYTSIRDANFTSLDSNEKEYWYNVTIRDEIGFINYTTTFKITLDTIFPRINLSAPGNDSFTNNELVEFNYTPVDTYLDTCVLYGNFTVAGFIANETNSSPVNGSINSFGPLNLSDGEYIWNVWCNDSADNNNFSQYNYTIKVDTQAPVISNWNANGTSFNIYEYICLNVSVTDSFAGVDTVFAEVEDPNLDVENMSLLDDGSGCDIAGGDNIYSTSYYLQYAGNYTWLNSHANDSAFNWQANFTNVTWNVTAVGSMTVDLIYPSADIEINESDGNLRVPSSVYLVPGWNLVGNPTNETKSVNQSFISIDGNFTEVRTYNTSLGTFISYVPGVGGALNQTQAYFGYWINATEYEVWIVD